MSRSGYTDECENVELWQAAVNAALRGKRGQAFLREMLAALDAQERQRLIADELVNEEGECCAIGSVALQRGTDVSEVETYDPDEVAEAFGIARAMAAEIMWRNDEFLKWDRGADEAPETPEQRYQRMRAWVASQIRVTAEELVSP